MGAGVQMRLRAEGGFWSWERVIAAINSPITTVGLSDQSPIFTVSRYGQDLDRAISAMKRKTIYRLSKGGMRARDSNPTGAEAR